MNKRSRACDINKKTKDEVWERDGHRCIICGSGYAMPNAHYIPRSNGGLGIPQNVVTLCMDCHEKMDHTTRRAEYRQMVREYLTDMYGSFEDGELTYSRF